MQVATSEQHYFVLKQICITKSVPNIQVDTHAKPDLVLRQGYTSKGYPLTPSDTPAQHYFALKQRCITKSVPSIQMDIRAQHDLVL